MRNNPTKAEARMWEELRKRKLLFLRFNRQFIVQHEKEGGGTEFFIADFYCNEIKLIIEIDGEYHQEAQQIQYDKIRTESLEKMGYHIARYTNLEVLNDMEGVLQKLTKFIKFLDGQKV